jgi:hypothetical protein
MLRLMSAEGAYLILSLNSSNPLEFLTLYCWMTFSLKAESALPIAEARPLIMLIPRSYPIQLPPREAKAYLIKLSVQLKSLG